MGRVSRQARVSRRKQRIIKESWRQRQRGLPEGRACLRRIDQSRREGILLKTLQANPQAAIREKGYRITIRRMESWHETLNKVQTYAKGIPRAGAEQIAEALCAAKVWRERTVGIGEGKQIPWVPAVIDSEGEPWGSTSLTPCFPVDALSLKRILKKEKIVHHKFVRRSEAFLNELQGYCAFLDANCPDAVFRVASYDALRTSLTAQISAIRRQIEDIPELHGTSLQEPTQQSPRNLAASVIVSILRRHGYEWARAIEACASLLAIAWPELDAKLEDSLQKDQLLEAIRGAYRRKGCPH